MGFLEQAGEELSAPVNKHWRDVAEYERYVMPLIVRLQSVDWPAVLALQSARWHREAINSLRGWKRQDGCYCWVGSFYNPRTGAYRQIQRYPLEFGLYPIRFCPPEGPPVSWGLWFRLADIISPNWIPEAHARRRYENYREMWRHICLKQDGQEGIKPNRRQYLADRLRNSSQRLGKYVRKDYWNASGMFYEVHYELEYYLNKALAGTDTPGSLDALRPTDLGEVEARLDHFRRCLRKFHEAETAPPAAIIEASAPAAPPAKAARAAEELRSLLADVHQHFPGILSLPFVPYPLEFVLSGLACYVGQVWAGPRQHSAPQDFDTAYYNQSPAGRCDFRAALRRIYDALTKELSSDPFGSQLFAAMSWKETHTAPDQSKEVMHTLAWRGATWLGDWLNWRELSPPDQLLDALETIQIANDNLRLTAAEPEHLPCLYVPDCAPEDEGPRFAALLREFERALPGKNSKRRDLLNRLERLRTLPLTRLRDGTPDTLTARFSALHWPGLSQRPSESEVSETFWLDLEQALKTRMEWASRAYDVVAGTLPAAAPPLPAEPSAPQSKANVPQSEPDAPTVADLCRNGFTPPGLSELLVRLAVIDTGGNCLTNDLRGKARGKRGAFTAAYRVLHRAGLLAPTATDSEWADAFKKEYGAQLGAEVVAHQLTPHGQAPTSAPGPFQKAVADAAEWVSEWKSRRKS